MKAARDARLPKRPITPSFRNDYTLNDIEIPNNHDLSGKPSNPKSRATTFQSSPELIERSP